MKLKIVLISPFKNKGLRVGQYFSPPMGIHRIASYLRKKTSASVEVYDPDLSGTQKLFDLIKEKQPDIIGFSLLYQTWHNDIDLMYKLKKLVPKSLLVAGGQGAVFSSDFLLKNTPLQIIIKGLGEFPMEKMIQQFSRKGSLVKRFGDINGLFIRRDSKGEIFDTGPAQAYIKSQFEEISLSLDFKQIPFEEYWSYMEQQYTAEHLRIMKNENMLHTIRLVSTSHCPRGCSFCSSTHLLNNAICGKQKVLFLNPAKMIRLVKNARAEHPAVKAFYFCDDDFFLNKQKVSEFCDCLKSDESLKDLTFFCLSRIGVLDRELLEKMHDVGFKFIIYGVESFSKNILHHMNKNMLGNDVKKVIFNTIENTIQSGITPLMNIILFYPTSTVNDIIETIDASVELVEKGARLTVYSYLEVYPGSSILKSDSLLFTYRTFECNNTQFTLPDNILPDSKEVCELAEQSLKLRDLLLQETLSKYDWRGVVPHPLFGLITFLAIYKILGKNTEKIENLIDKLMQSETENVLSVNLKRGVV